jgi:FKBP-type peptidyl-prolyl cis-trans isomerase SlyD
MTQHIENGKVVTLTYSIRNESGETIEQNDVPGSYLHGAGSDLHEKIERNLEGHAPGDVIETTILPEEGFGAHDPNLVYTDRIENVPPEYQHLGAQAQFRNDRGEVRTFIVTNIRDGKVTLDGNHPFAGRTIIFSVRVEGVRDATQQELAHGEPDPQYGTDVMDPSRGRH